MGDEPGDTANGAASPQPIEPTSADELARALSRERSLREEAERVVERKDELISAIVHDLRSPLNAMLGWIQILRLGPAQDPKHLAEGLEVIERNAHRQSRLVADLADASSIASGKVELHRRTLRVDEVVAAAIQAVANAARARSLHIEQRLPEPDVRVDGDPERLRKILSILLDHATATAPAGGTVEVSAGVVDARVEIRVAIPLVAAPRLSAASSSGPANSARNENARNEKKSGRIGGSGLQYYVVQCIAELHGGSLRAAPEGPWATFVLSLPRTGDGAAPRSAP